MIKAFSKIHRCIAPDHIGLGLSDQRKCCWTLPRQIIQASDWLESLWIQSAVLKTKKILTAKGMKDPEFRKDVFNQWIEVFPLAKAVCYSDAGHFVSEEKWSELAEEIQIMLA